MKAVVESLLALVVRHWLRIGVLLILFFVISKKQINLNIQLGKPAVPLHHNRPLLTSPSAGEKSIVPMEKPTVLTDDAKVATQSSGWLQQMNIFNSSGYPELSLSLQEVSEQQIKAFINRFYGVARTEQQKFGVPASITLANALLHSTAGSFVGSHESNNLFRLSCTDDWLGPKLTVEGACYRRYDNAWTSFRDHSLYVTTGNYGVLNQLGSKDYRGWADGLEALAFNDTQNLSQQLLTLIDEWQLFQYDS